MKFNRKIIPDSNYHPSFITKKRLYEDEIDFDQLRSYRLSRVKQELTKRDIGACAFRGNSGCRLSSATYMSRIQNGSNGGYVSENGFSSSSAGFNFGAANFLQRPDKRMNSGFIYDVNLANKSKLTFKFKSSLFLD